MKFLQVFFAFVCLATMTAGAYAECDNCPDQPWAGPFTGNVVVGPFEFVWDSCVVDYSYKTRSTCNGDQEISITSMKVIGTSSLCNFDRMLYEVLRDLMQTNPMGFHPLAGEGCVSTWRVSGSACWAHRIVVDIAHGTYTLYEPCDFVSACCYQRYRVCRLADGTVTLLSLSDGYTSTGNCPPACPHNACPSIRNLDGPPPNAGKTVTGSSSEETMTIALLRPNPTSGLAELPIVADSEGDLNLVVAALNGEIVLNRKIDVNGSGEQNITVDLNGVPAGTYQYMVMRKDLVVSKGQIKVVR